MIHVLATIRVKPGAREAFLKHFVANVPNVLAEEGCHAYAPVVDVASGIGAQAPVRPDVVVVVEQWESLAHLKAHLIAPHMATYREKVKELVLGAELQVLESVC